MSGKNRVKKKLYSYFKEKKKIEIKGNFNKLIQDIRVVLCMHQMQNNIYYR